MKIKGKEIDLKNIGKIILSIALGTGIGLIVYGIFLYFNIAIFGWNLGLIFAPLAAGYVETVVANRILGRNLGAISAFILFIDTTVYSFILKNPTLGTNLITAGSIIVILQAAFPTLINYILLVIIGAIISNLSWSFKKIIRTLKKIKSHIRWETENIEEEIIEEDIYFDENESNERLNSLNFFFITSTDMENRKHELLGIYQSEVVIENKVKIKLKDDELEKKNLKNIKEGKDKCLINLSKKIKEAGGNGILDLHIQYGLIGLGTDYIHITATGMGINILKE
ncbi:hypothetical protein [Methanobrevibacter sp.]|uniref:hypothetical protein n=1 Tax=Methanobrevibacter sp. TaxID=66852 RepID=UPI002E773584|nr:hypothetical protein [Methanobrevibacter sp.]MEE1335414.1 hypothetical protein [Methanobrevibacter sp.]